MKLLLFLPLLSINISAALLLNTYKVSWINILKAKTFYIHESTIGDLAANIAETFSSRSFLQCSSHGLETSKYAGILYDELHNCRLLSATTGIREQADDSGTVKVILYGADPDGKVLYPSFNNVYKHKSINATVNIFIFSFFTYLFQSIEINNKK